MAKRLMPRSTVGILTRISRSAARFSGTTIWKVIPMCVNRCDAPAASRAMGAAAQLRILQERLELDAQQRAEGMAGMTAEERAQLVARIERERR